MSLKAILARASRLNPISGMSGEHVRRRELLSRATGQDWDVKVLSVKKAPPWRMAGTRAGAYAMMNQKGEKMGVYSMRVPSDKGYEVETALNKAFPASDGSRRVFGFRTPHGKNPQILVFDKDIEAILEALESAGPGTRAGLDSVLKTDEGLEAVIR